MCQEDLLKILRKKNDWITARELAQIMDKKLSKIYTYVSKLRKFGLIEIRYEKKCGPGYNIAYYRIGDES